VNEMTFVFLPEHARAYFKEETSFGQKPSGQFAYVGVIQEASPVIDPSLIKLRGLEGSPDLTYIRKGLKAPDITLKYTPRNTTFLAYVLQRTKSLAVEYLVVDDWDTPSNLVSLMFLGQKLGKLTIDVPEEEFIEVTAACVGQNFTISDEAKQADSYGDIPTDDPLSWFETYIKKGGVEISRYGKWTLEINNHVVRKPVVRSTDANLAKYVLATKRDVGGTIEAYFEDKSELNDVVNDTAFELKLYIATKYFTVSGCKWDRARIPTSVDSYPVKLPMPFTGKTVTLT